MIACVDVGATKTLVGFASFDSDIPNFTDVSKFKTPADAKSLFDQITHRVKQAGQVSSISIALPGSIDHKNNRVEKFGNRDWSNISPAEEVASRLGKDISVFIENDGALAALSESVNGSGAEFNSVYYTTISTGIGGGFTYNKKVVSSVSNTEPGQMMFDYQGSFQKWESFASGKALHETYGQLASEITDNKIWQEYAKLLAIGFIEISALFYPECIVVGGSVGAQLDKYVDALKNELATLAHSYVPVPTFRKAAYPNEAVLRGCFYYAAENN